MIGKDMFDSYECNRPIRVKLDVGKLAEFFKSNESADRLTISSNNSDLLINLVSTRKFKMKNPKFCDNINYHKMGVTKTGI